MTRRSREIPACVVLLATATALSGCNDGPRRDCVDANGRKMPDSYCDSAAHTGGHFVYGGSGGRSVGSTVEGGSVERGGFGSGEGSEGGEGGGRGGGGEGGGGEGGGGEGGGGEGGGGE